MFFAKILRGVMLSLLLVCGSAAQAAASEAAKQDENLPPLLETAPTTHYDVLSPIGAGKKDVLEARQQLRREAAKVQAEAVIVLLCEEGGVGHQGMTWYHKDAYCRGLAIRYRPTAEAATLPRSE